MPETPNPEPLGTARGCLALACLIGIPFDCAGCLSGDYRFWYVSGALIGLTLPVAFIATIVESWGFWRVPPPTSPPAATTGATRVGIPVRVIATLSPGVWRVIVGVGVGQLDGGIDHDWPEAWVPPAARRPNGEFAIAGFVGGVPQVVE